LRRLHRNGKGKGKQRDTKVESQNKRRAERGERSGVQGLLDLTRRFELLKRKAEREGGKEKETKKESEGTIPLLGFPWKTA
jgi:hypothetical protein